MFTMYWITQVWFCPLRETFLQALRGVTFGAGQKMGDAIRKTLTSTLLETLGHGEVSYYCSYTHSKKAQS